MLKKRLLRISKLMVFSAGFVFLIMLMLSFTTLPYWGIYKLASSESKYTFQPEFIVLLGGAGVPSSSALIRTYYTANLAKTFPKATIVIALPEDLSDSTNYLDKMKQELRMRHVLSPVLFESKGTNTRAQALYIKRILKNNLDAKLLIVTSPEHMYRSIKTFKKLGFDTIGGCPTFEEDVPLEFLMEEQELEGIGYLSDIGRNTQFRYQVWNHLIYEIRLIREYGAITYYKLQSWI